MYFLQLPLSSFVAGNILVKCLILMFSCVGCLTFNNARFRVVLVNCISRIKGTEMDEEQEDGGRGKVEMKKRKRKIGTRGDDAGSNGK